MLKIIGDLDLSDGYFDHGIGVGSKLKRGKNPLAFLHRYENDYWIGNFECVCSNVKETGIPFIINPQHLNDFPHCNLYGVANNHVMQYGAKAYEEMLKYFDNNNILYVGSDERRSARFRHQEKEVGIIAFSLRPDNFSDKPLYWHLPEYTHIEAEIDKLIDCDYRIAFIHWGYEFINYPNIEQKKFAHWLVDKGIDLVIGMHPHVIQGYEIYKDRHIFYSLGNGVFNMPWEPTKYGLMLSVDLNGEPQVNWDYIKIEESFPKIVKKVPEKYTMQYLNSRLTINEEDEKYFAKAKKFYLEYRKNNRKDILKNFIKIGPLASWNIISEFISRKVISRK